LINHIIPPCRLTLESNGAPLDLVTRDGWERAVREVLLGDECLAAELASAVADISR
jgi:hypothetical protein